MGYIHEQSMKALNAILAALLSGIPAWSGIPDSAHPDFELGEIRMPALYKTMGLAFLENGTLVLATAAGDLGLGEVPKSDPGNKVLLIEGASTVAMPDRITEVANSWKQITGLNVLDGRIYVVDRDGFYQILDNAPSGSDLNANRRLVVAWPDEGKWDNGPYWHQWVFTPVYRSGRFYAPYSGSLGHGGGSSAAPTSLMSGAMLKWNPDGSYLEPIAGGFRSPNGAALDAETGEIFVTDNQGSWLPSSTFMRIRPGQFYGHRQSQPDPDSNGVVPVGFPPNFAESLPYEAPVAWLPHGEVRSSPSQPIQIRKGWFAGHWLIGDVNNPGLVRVYLDRVGDLYNGAVFRFCKGMGIAAVNRMIADPDGAIIIGTIASISGNWPGGEKTPLYRLSAKSGPSGFDLKAVRAFSGGLELEFTQPVDPDSLGEEHFSAKSRQYVRVREYGQGRKPDEPCPISAVEASTDRKRVFLAMPELRTDRVVHLRLNGIVSSGGKPLWNDEAWFTLNAIPAREWQPTSLTRPEPPKRGAFRGEIAVRRGILEVTLPDPGSYRASLITPAGAVVDRRIGAGPARLRFARPVSARRLYILRVEHGSGGAHSRCESRPVVF